MKSSHYGVILFPIKKEGGLIILQGFFFNRDLDELADIEISQLLVIARRPSRYENNPERLERESNEFLEKYRKNSAANKE